MDPAKPSKWVGKYKSLKEYYTEAKIKDVSPLETDPARRERLAYEPEYFEFDKYELEIDPDETEEEVEAYDAHKQRQETMKCAYSFFYWCHKYCRILHPMQGIMPFILYKYQRFVIREYENNRFNIIRKFRQGGLTTVTLLWGLWKCLFQLDQQIMVVSKTDREAVDIGVIIDRSYDKLPKWMSPDKRLGKWNDHVKTFPETGGRIMFHTPEAARGKAMTYLVIDEAAFIDDMEKHWKALYPTLSTGGNCIAISTVHGMGNWYQETYYGAKDGINKFNVIDLVYTSHPEYHDPRWVEDQQAQLGEEGWRQEVLGDFLSSGNTYIPTKIIERLDERAKQMITVRKLFPQWINKDSREELASKMKLIEWRRAKGLPDLPEDEERGALWVFKEPVDGHEYLIGADAAEGVGGGGDNSCFQVLDISTTEQVAEFYSNTIPPHNFAEVLHHIGKYYNTALMVVENMSPGGAVISLLQHNLFYDNLYYEQNAGSKSMVRCGVKTGPLNRPMILEAMQRRMMNGTVIVNSARIVKELGTFIFNKVTKKAEAEKGKHDDGIMALALACYVRDANMRDIPLGGVTEDMLKDMQRNLTSVEYENIKNEVLRGAPEDWLGTEEDEGSKSVLDEEDILPGVILTFRRRHDKLLKEFGF